MADNVVANAGSGGETFATDDIGGVHYPRTKIVIGADNTNDGDISSANPMPVTATNAGTFATQVDGDALTALQLIDDIVATDDTSTHATGTTKGAVIMAAATPTDGSVDANDLGAVAMSTDRRLHTDTQIVGQDANLTVDLGATDNAVLDAIDSNTDYGAVVGGGAEATALRVTLANDSTGVVSVDDNGSSLTVDQATASNLNAQVVGNVASAATDSGNPVKIGGIFNTTQPTVTTGQRVNAQMTSRGALIVGTGVSNLGTNVAQMNGTAVTMGNGASGTGVQRVTIASDSTGQVNVASVTPGTGASNLGKAEDAAHTSGDVGVQMLAVRNDDLDALAGTDGDYAPLQVTQNGALLMCPAANDDYKYAVVNVASSGDNTIVSAVTSRKIRVLSCLLMAGAATTVRFESGAAGTALTGQMEVSANGGFTLPFNPAGWFETAVNTLLNLELSAANNVDGMLTYIEVP